ATASSIDFTFQIQKPATSSLVSAKGPSTTVRVLPLNCTRLPLLLGCCPSPACMMPAFTSCSLNLPISVSSFSLGMTPASEFFVAFTITITFMVVSYPFSTGPTLPGTLAIDHPGDPEPIREHPELQRPERLGQGHRNPAALRERPIDPLGVRRRLRRHVHREALRLLEAARRAIGRHQLRVPQVQLRVQDLLPPLRRHLLRGGRPLVGHHRLDLPSQDLGVQRERFLALPIEQQVRVDLFLPPPTKESSRARRNRQKIVNR